MRPAGIAASVLALGVALAWAPPRARAQEATVSLRLDKQEVAVGEPFMLEARVDIEEGDFESMQGPDLRAFEVLGRRESRPFSFSFNLGQGTTSRSSVVRTYKLRALRPGTVELGPVRATVDGKQLTSATVTLTVEGSAAAGAAPPAGADGAPTAAAPEGEPPPEEADSELFLHAVADKPRARVGEQVTVTIYLYSRRSLHSAPVTTQEPSTEGFWTHNLLPPSRTLSPTVRAVRGRVYNIYVLQRFAAFPIEPGTQRIGSMRVELGGSGSIFDLLRGSTRSVARESEPLEIEVAPLPEALDRSAPWHVGSLEVSFEAAPQRVAEDDAVTLTAAVQGEGNLRALRLPSPTLPGFEVLEPTVEDDVTTTGDRVGGTRRYEWLALARERGTHTASLPPIQLVDPDTGKIRELAVDPLQVTVTPRAAAAAGADGQPGAEAGERTDRAPQRIALGPPRTHAELEPRSTTLHERALFWGSLAAFPLAAALFTLWNVAGRARERRRAQGGRDTLTSQARRALQQARAEQLETPQRWLRLQHALLLGVEARLGEPVTSLTYDALERRLSEESLPADFARQLVGLLREAEAARFTPAAVAAAPAAATDRAQALLDQLTRGQPRPAPHAAGGVR